jgi:hypothetical protein
MVGSVVPGVDDFRSNIFGIFLGVDNEKEEENGGGGDADAAGVDAAAAGADSFAGSTRSDSI